MDEPDHLEVEKVETADAAIVASVVADIVAINRPIEEPELDRVLRLLDRQELDARIRERDEREAAAREQEQRAEQAREQKTARAAASRALMEQAAQRQRERDACLDRERLARLEAEAAARRVPQLTPEERKRQQTVAAYEELSAMLHAWANPPRDPLAEIDALHADLAAREEALEQRMAAQREASRSAKFQADQAAAVARRESGKW